MKELKKIKERLNDELRDMSRRDNYGRSELEYIHMLTDTIKNIDKICALEDEESGYSEARHWVRGHYSRDGYDYDRGNAYERDGRSYDGRGGYSERRDSRGRYSRGGTKEHLEAALASADPEDRKMIERLIDKMG